MQSILIAEDDLINRLIIAEILRPHYATHVVSNGVEALDCLGQGNSPDLIITDVLMPGMDGFELCRHIKQHRHTKHIPVLFLSGLDSNADEELGFTLGASDYIHKPISPPVLLARVRTHIELARVRRQLMARNAKLEERVQLRTRELQEVNRQLEREIAERNRTEVLMRKFGMAIEQTADSVAITDHRGIIEYVNGAFERMTGHKAQEAVGRTFSIIKSGHHGEGFYRNLWKTLSEGNVFQAVMVNRHSSGTLFYEEKTITPLKDGSGRIAHYVSTGKDITDRKEVEDRLHHLAHHDALTDLPNRALFNDRLDHAMSQALRNNRHLALFFIDLDNFKDINDTLGHAAGDSLLIEVSRRLINCIRDSDTVARLGGDEFTIILEGLSDDTAAANVASLILENIVRPANVGGHEVLVSASIGITLFPTDAADRETLCRNADIAMYRAKELGRNNYQFFTEDLATRATRRLTMEQLLRCALERNEFELHYQPKVCLSTGAVTGVEALMRWNNPAIGPISPDIFIPVLESIGLISQVGDWVLREACQLIGFLHADGCPISIAVNLSARQLLDPQLHQRIAEHLASNGVAPRYLELEITESLLIENLDLASKALRQINDIGIQIAIDDFGTGYSSLAYLKRLPINILKIDRAFVGDLPDDQDDTAITTAIIAMAHSLKLNVVAEGVETQMQAEFLRSLGCQVGQGYLFSRPVNRNDLCIWLMDRRKSFAQACDINPQRAQVYL